MKIALIFPPYKPKIFSENLNTVDEEFCVAPPIILAYVAAILEKHGHKVMLLDARALNLSKEKALNKIRKFGPDVLGFRAEAYYFHDALEWIKYLKEHLGVPVFTGGVNMTLYPRETISHPEIDYGIVGEATEALPAFIARLENADKFDHLPGLAYKDDDGEIIINEPSGKLVDFDAYPFPARHLLENDKYYSFISQRKNFTIMLTSTGCPFKCTFCAIPTAYRARSPESVIKEIEACYRDFNVREIDFFDAVLFMPRDRVLEIFRRIQERKFDLEWSCRSRVDLVDDEILREAARAGCRQIYYGIESVNQDVLNKVNKRISPEKVIEAINTSRKYGIKTMGFFMVGNPGDTPETVRQTIEFAKNLNLDFIQVCRTIPKPGTNLDREAIGITGRDLWREHISGKKITGRIPCPWSDLTEKDKEELTKEFYIKFYFRPRLLWRRILELKSVGEFVRYVWVGLKMFNYRPSLSSIITDTTEAEAFLERSREYMPKARMLKVAVVIPTYNERENIERIIAGITDILPNARIVIVDDDSPDGTSAIVKRLSTRNSNIHLIRRSGKKRGLGLAYKDGFGYVLNNLDSDYIFEMDADLSHNPQYLPVFLHYARHYDYGLVTGSRFLARVSIVNRTPWRNVISKTTKWFTNVITGLKLTDVTTGFKCFKRSAIEKMDFDKIRSKGYAFQIEVSYQLSKLGVPIKEVPIVFIERTAGNSKMSGAIMLEGIFIILKLSLENLMRGRHKGIIK